jgi:hypothetical protein
VAVEVDRAMLDKAADVTALVLRGAMGGEGSQPPSFAAEVFREVWNAMREAAKDLSERARPGF